MAKKIDRIVQSLKEQIATGILKPGDRLPSEMELAKEFGVSRLTAREALKRLEFEGLVRTESTAGRFVAGGEKVQDSTLKPQGELIPIGEIKIEENVYSVFVDQKDNLFLSGFPFPEKNALLVKSSEGWIIYKLYPANKEPPLSRIEGLTVGRFLFLLRKEEKAQFYFGKIVKE